MVTNYRTVALADYQRVLAGYCGFSLSRALLENSQIGEDIEAINELLQTNEEAYSLYCSYGDFCGDSIEDIREIIDKLSKEQLLSSDEFMVVRQLLRAIEKTRKYYQENKIKLPLIQQLFKLLSDCSSLSKEIDKVFLTNGQINEQCSPLLKEITAKQRQNRQQLQEMADAFIKSNANKMMENIIVERNSRNCLLLKNSYRNSAGLIHGESASTAAIYFEPNSFIPLNNQLTSLKEQWDLEVWRILKALGASIYQKQEELLLNQEIYSKLDSFQAKAKYMLETKAVNATIVEEATIQLQQARHPEISRERAVVNDFYLDQNKRILLISGPNTGGKTVSLKLIGLLVLASYCGLPITTLSGKIGFFSSVFIDIGDQQSISASLSTFSSHLSQLKEIIEKADDKSLVIIDELGTGTDPAEGAALAVAITEFLLKQQAIAILTTHYDLLKQYAYTQPAIQIASMAYDLQNNQPTYQLVLDSSGNSYGLAIAANYGLKPEILASATKILQDNSKESEVLIRELNDKISLLDKKSEEIQLLEAGNIQLQKELNTQLELIENTKIQEYEKARNQAMLYLQEFQEAAQQLIEQYKTDNIQPKAIKLQADLANLIKEEEKEEEKPELLEVGDWVEITSSGQLGEIVELSKRQALLNVNAVKIKIALSKISKTDKRPLSLTSISKEVTTRSPLHNSINLIGNRVDEALTLLVPFLDSCLLSNFSEAVIIHGVGSGALKNAIWDYLKKQKYVVSFRLGNYNEGSAGVTIVEFVKKA